MREFKGKVAVVTGAASGMGRAFAERFAAEGMKVVLADIETPALEISVAELRARGYDVIGVETDVAKPEAVQALADRTLAEYGKVHVVCNNAGVEGYLRGPLWEATDKDWQWTFGVDFWGVVNGVRTFLPLMLAQEEEGHIVNTASATGLVMSSNMYGIAKHAVVALSEVLYAQLEQAGAPVGISVLCPGMVNTRLFFGSRNRPQELRNEGEEPPARPYRDLSNEMPPADVAGIVIDAIRDDQFYILTDHDWDERMRTRWDNIINRRNPAVGPRRAAS